MRRYTKTIVAGVAMAVIVSASASPAFAEAPSQAGDQARLDAVIDSFEQRLTDAGWVGAPAEDDEGDEADDTDAESDAIGDDEFNQCFGELAAVLEDVDGDEFPGQTALRESLEFTYVPDGAVPETTEEFFDLGDEETVVAFAASVDDTGTALLDQLVDAMGAKETGDCMREAMEADMASSTDEEVPAEFEFAVANEADLGVGERSARVQFGLDMNFMGMAMVFDFSMYMARVDRDLVMLVHGTFGTPEELSGFDPLAELQTLVDAL